MEDGLICIIFYANDSCGHISKEKITLIKDSITPDLTIISPHDQDLFGINPPEFIVKIADPHRDFMWYSFDGGITNIFFEENTTFTLSEWEKYSESVNITFYANDSVGNIISKEITLLKDIESPEITINDPVFNQLFGKYAPGYDINVVDDNLDKFWYYLAESGSNISIESLTGTIDQTIWNSLPNGHITLRFYANDSLGNTGYSEVIIVKDYTPENPQSSIPGFNVILIIPIIGIVSIVYLKRKYKLKS
ncbi:MAG: hypothetical protein GF316_20465 [Candidatus Lokiarchaeota archaeon]|nr:hypothetical protein [Candidatus Lokiarchaeota archaeon]